MTKAELLKIAKPILFNTEMVTAILEGRKTVTRRLVKSKSKKACGFFVTFRKFDNAFMGVYDYDENEMMFESPQTQPAYAGDILYVRETWGKIKNGIEEKYVYRTDGRYPTLGDGCFMNFKWKPSIHMPKEAARIFLKVKDVRVERLQNMNEVDTAKEGIRTDVQTHRLDDPDFIENFGGIDKFKVLWDSTINKSDLELYGWDANPYVWVIEFERIEV